MTALAATRPGVTLPPMSTAAINDRPLTYEEERGKPMPSKNHAAVQTNLAIEFSRARDFRVLSELNVSLGGQPFTPDLCVYSRQPLDYRHDVVRVAEPPLVIVEIFSPSQGYQDVMDKVTHYLEHGVKSCWVVIPPTRTITIYTPDGAQQTSSEGIAIDPAVGIEADLAAVFS